MFWEPCPGSPCVRTRNNNYWSSDMNIDYKANIGRADMIRLMALGGDIVQQQAFARLCGLEKIEVEEEIQQATIDERPVLTGPGVPEPVEQARLGLWRVVKAEYSDDEEQTEVPGWFVKASPITRSFLRNAHRPEEDRPFPLLSPWSRLWPFLRRELSVVASSRAVDTRALVRQMARCRPVRHVPRRRVQRWANAIHLLYDTSDSMRTFFKDMEQLAKRLGMICGRHRLKIFVFPQGVAYKGYQLGKGTGVESLLTYRAPEQTASVLALSDLGSLTGDRAAGKWARDLGRDLALTGSRAVALMPCPPWRWTPGIGRFWRAAWWDMGRRLSVTPFLRSVTSLENTGDDFQGRAKKSSSLQDFLRLMSPVIKPDPELIRYIRDLLPVKETDAGMEADIWLRRYDYRARLDEFSLVKPLARRQRLVDLLHWFHANFPEIRAEEITIIMSKDEDLASPYEAEADEINARLAKSMDGETWRIQGFSDDEYKGYMKRREERLPDEAFADERVATAWALSHHNKDGQFDADIPPELPMDKLAWVFKPGKIRQYRLTQVADSISISQKREVEAGRNASPLGLLETKTDFVFIKTLKAPGSIKESWRLHEPGPIILKPILDTMNYRIETSGSVLELAQIPKPDWAGEIGRDRNGLFVRLHDNRRFYWLNPGRYKIGDQRGLSIIEMTEGRWLQENKYLKYMEAGNLAEDSEEYLAEDQYGLYEVIFIRGVRQVFRWITPGRFLMGSPEDEPQRYENELQHEVEISQGFWLADTACTQSLWEAIMDENPSRFKGPDLPVEQVSWDNCQEFMRRVSDEIPDLKICLPTEAQWEYACRADTTTPFWFGDMITPEQVNYNGDYAYADAGKGKNRKQTVAVRSLPPNSRGLYEIHGNVFEWCSDWAGPYENKRAVDPRGPSEGVKRILRGGSWFSYARYCRSAYRYAFAPNECREFGFRLCVEDKPLEKSSVPRERRIVAEFVALSHSSEIELHGTNKNEKNEMKII